jgi:hypothetical protein
MRRILNCGSPAHFLTPRVLTLSSRGVYSAALWESMAAHSAEELETITAMQTAWPLRGGGQPSVTPLFGQSPLGTPLKSVRCVVS